MYIRIKALHVGLFLYHFRSWLWIRPLATGVRSDTTTWRRWFNEIPVVFLLGIALLAVAKPF